MSDHLVLEIRMQTVNFYFHFIFKFSSHFMANHASKCQMLQLHVACYNFGASKLFGNILAQSIKVLEPLENSLVRLHRLPPLQIGVVSGYSC